MFMFHLDESLGYQVSRLAGAMRTELESGLARFGLTAPQWAVLMRLLEREGWSQKELGDTLGTDKATIGGVLMRLEAKGLVARTRDGRDGRVLVASATAKGRIMAQETAPLAGAVNRRVAKSLTVSEMADLKALLAQSRSTFPD